MITRRLLFALLAPALSAFAVRAEGDGDAAPEKPASLFAQLFPKPSGTNGFEEITQAGDRLKDATASYPPRREFTLTKRRAYLADPACRAALSLLRRGAGKTIMLPELDPKLAPGFVVFAPLRSLARLLATDIYVRLADGDTEGAVRAASVGLAMAHPLKSVSAIGGMVGTALDGLVLTPLIAERGAWSVSDCGRIIRLVQKYRALPDPTEASWNAERAITAGLLKPLRASPNALADAIEEENAPGDGKSDTPKSQAAKRFADELRADPALRDRLLQELDDDNNARFDRAIALAKDPTQKMSLLPTPGDDAKRHPRFPLVRSLSSLGGDDGKIVQSQVQSRVVLQLVAVHAAIRAYRWENDVLPKALADLKLPADLATDPFTAAPLLYEPDALGTGYLLASAGALMPGESGKQDGRERFAFPHEPVAPKPQ